MKSSACDKCCNDAFLATPNVQKEKYEQANMSMEKEKKLEGYMAVLPAIMGVDVTVLAKLSSSGSN